MTLKDTEKWEKGRRAEEVGVFYLRLNGFFTIPNFAIHHDSVRNYMRTEADIVGVRFPLGMEHSVRVRMKDDAVFVDLAGEKRLFVLVEIKAGTCDINGPWAKERREAEENLTYVIKRLGLVRASLTAPIAVSLFNNFTWENEDTKVVRLCIGSDFNPNVQARQILFKKVAVFFRRRFSDHPLKLPGDVDSLRLWGDFGHQLAQWCQKNVVPYQDDQPSTDEALREAMERYIAGGSMELPASLPSR